MAGKTFEQINRQGGLRLKRENTGHPVLELQQSNIAPMWLDQVG